MLRLSVAPHIFLRLAIGVAAIGFGPAEAAGGEPDISAVWWATHTVRKSNSPAGGATLQRSRQGRL
jgi:hypothetical protein